MKYVFIVVDDKPKDDNSLPSRLGEEILHMTGGEYGTKILPNALIRHSLPQIRTEVYTLSDNYDVVGILVDLCQQATGDTEAGVSLLRKLKQDEELRHLDVVIYTALPVGLKRQEWIGAGAKDVISRDFTSGTVPEQDLAKAVLKAFDVEID